MTDAELITGYLESLRWRNRSINTINIRRTYLSHLSMTLGLSGAAGIVGSL